MRRSSDVGSTPTTSVHARQLTPVATSTSIRAYAQGLLLPTAESTASSRARAISRDVRRAVRCWPNGTQAAATITFQRTSFRMRCASSCRITRSRAAESRRLKREHGSASTGFQTPVRNGISEQFTTTTPGGSMRISVAMKRTRSIISSGAGWPVRAYLRSRASCARVRAPVHDTRASHTPPIASVRQQIACTSNSAGAGSSTAPNGTTVAGIVGQAIRIQGASHNALASRSDSVSTRWRERGSSIPRMATRVSSGSAPHPIIAPAPTATIAPCIRPSPFSCAPWTGERQFSCVTRPVSAHRPPRRR